MFDLFRFIMLRPPEKTDERDGILIAKETELHGQLLRLRSERNRWPGCGKLPRASCKVINSFAVPMEFSTVHP